MDTLENPHFLMQAIGISVAIIVAILAVAFVVGLIFAVKKRREMMVDAEEQERAFEQQLHAEAAAGVLRATSDSITAPQSPRPLQNPHIMPTAPVLPSPLANPATASPIEPPPLPNTALSTGAVGPEELSRRLVALRVFGEREGKIPLPMPPEGLIFRMKKGGTAAVLPRLESAEQMGYFAKRFDMVVAELPNGEVLVVERLQSRLPQLMDDFGNMMK